jgi:hypothetical protein
MNAIPANWLTQTQAPATGAAAGSLSGTQTLGAIGLLAGTIVATGAIIVWARRVTPDKAPGTPDSGVVRSWVAIVLVAGLLIFCAYAFSINDSSLRSTLVGALAASTGTVIAYYFASKSSEQARQDILNATFGTDSVPDLQGKTEAQATDLMSKTSFRLEADPAARPASNADIVTKQYPQAPGTSPKGSTVTVTYAPAAPKP